MKTIVLLSLALTASEVKASEITEYGYDCDCISSKKTCDGIENFSMKLSGNKAEGSIWNYDGEFNTGYEAKEGGTVPPKYETYYARYKITSNPEYLPGTFEDADILIMNAMKAGGLARKGGGYGGKVVIIGKKSNRMKVEYTCENVGPDNI